MAALTECGRFAPSATGSAHPGTLLAGLLCWLDLRSRGARAVLRIEDLDPQRCSAQKTRDLREQLWWFGLDDWDVIEIQSENHRRHQQALGQLRAQGLLYPCSCSRNMLATDGLRSRDGGWRYGGRCRGQQLIGNAPDRALRLRLDCCIQLRDETGADLGYDVAAAFGDPVVRRRDGAIAYHLASVVDDAAQGVTRVVRGRDLATSSGLQVALQRVLGYQSPSYRHHCLLLEEQGRKLAKFHGAVGVPALREAMSAEACCGFLAWVCGLQPSPEPTRPRDLLSNFSWSALRQDDVVVHWDGTRLSLANEGNGAAPCSTNG